MGRRSAGFLALGCALATAAGGPRSLAAGDPKPGPGVVRSPEFVAGVNAAVDRGVLWLSRCQDVGGAFNKGNTSYGFIPPFDLGLQALSLYTVRSCGLSPEDPVAKLGLKRMRMIYDANRHGRGNLQNYSVSLTLLALDAYYSPRDDDGADARYGRSLRPRRNIPDADLSWIRELVAWLVAAQTAAGSFGYQSPAGQGATWEDHSNAQFSLLALKAARRCGVDVPKAVFRKALDHFLRAQEASGPDVVRKDSAGVEGNGGKSTSTARDRARGWGYQCKQGRREATTGSMTSAGVSSLVICRGELLGTSGYDSADDARVVQAIRDGIAWLGHNFSITGNPTGGGRGFAGYWHYYYLYGLERAGVLAGVTWMADHEWYGEGAAFLLRAGSADGSWSASASGPRNAPLPGIEGDLMDTCFALLFLKKATFRVEGAVATEGADTELDLAGVGDLDDDSFRAVFDSVFRRYVRTGKDRKAERCVDFVRMGTRAIPHLIRRLEDEEPPARQAAIEVLEKVTGVTHGFKAEDPVEARVGAVTAWEEWWFSRRRTLAPDVGAGRFR
jgi:hypothetical protein